MGSAWLQADRILQIAVVTNRDIVLAGLRSLLTEHPGLHTQCTVSGACSASEAVLSLPDTLGLILLCSDSPDESQILASMQNLRRHAPTVPVVVLADSHSPQLIRRVLAAQAAGFIPSSTPATLLIAALEVVVQGGIYVPVELLNTSLDAHTTRSALYQPMFLDAGVELTARQRNVLELLLAGRSNKEIARELGLTIGTVKNYVSALLKATHTRTRSHALATFKTGTAFTPGDTRDEASSGISGIRFAS